MAAKTDVTETLVLKKVPLHLKNFWGVRAKMNGRSVTREIIGLLEQERTRLLEHEARNKDLNRIRQIIEHMHALPVTDDRPSNALLYDEDGMPR